MPWTVSDVMTKEVVTVDPDTGFKFCVNLLRLHDVSALPVVSKDGKLLGIVSEFDLLTKEVQRGARPRRPGPGRVKGSLGSSRVASEIMTSPAIAIGPGATIAEAARLIHDARVKRLPVIDPDGLLVGIASRSDLLKPFLRSDESIRREIVDKVLTKLPFIQPKMVEIEVTSGVVTLRGELESRIFSELLVYMVESVEGTIGVDSKLTYRLDDRDLDVERPLSNERQP